MIQDAAVVAETERMLEVEEVVEVEPTGRGGACGVRVKDYLDFIFTECTVERMR